MNYALDPNALDSRFFSSRRLYSDVDWSNFDQIVDAYGGRIRDWYIEPSRVLAGNIHFAFSVMALNCLLIDAMSQFVSGRTSAHRDEFMAFIRDRLPGHYSAPVSGGVPRYIKGELDPLTSVDQVLYHGFRCGILHEAHIPLYCAVAPSGPSITVVPPNGSVKHSTANLDCPVVIVNPLALRDDIEAALETYLQQLKNRDNNTINCASTSRRSSRQLSAWALLMRLNRRTVEDVMPNSALARGRPASPSAGEARPRYTNRLERS